MRRGEKRGSHNTRCVKENNAGAYTLKLFKEPGSDTAAVNVYIRSMYKKKKEKS